MSAILPGWRFISMLGAAACLALSCSSSTDPNPKVQAGLTAREAEQLAADRALQVLGNPALISIVAPESGGGLDREGRLALGARGRWWFTYYESGDFRALVVETEGSHVRWDFVTLDNFPSLQEVPLDYIDSAEALMQAEGNGGEELADVDMILANLIGEPIWPSAAPRKIAWLVTYKLAGGGSAVFYVDAVTGVYLGRG